MKSRSQIRSRFELRSLARIVLLSVVFLHAQPSDGSDFRLPALRGTWYRVESENFTLYSDGLPSDAVRDLRGLETLRSALLSLVPNSDAPSLHTQVFTFAHRNEVQPYLDLLFDTTDSDATGAFVSHQDGGIAFVDRTARDRRSDEHELVHAILAPAGTLPLWLHEGLAEYFSHYRPRDRSLVFGAFLKGRAASLRGQRLMTLSEVMALTAESELYRTRGDRGLFYGESWALVHRLMAEHGSLEKMRKLVAALIDGESIDQAMAQSFAIPLVDLERSLRSYASVVPPLPHMVTVDASPAAAPHPERLSRGALLATLGDALNRARPQNGKLARLHYDEALRENADEPRALTAIALSDWSEHPERNEEQISRALSGAPDDPLIPLRYAQLLLTRAVGGMPTMKPSSTQCQLLRKARPYYRRALALTPGDLVARGGYGMTFLAEEKEYQQGLEALRAVHAALPQRTDFAAALLFLEYRQGNGDRFFAQLDASHDPQIRLTARAVKADVLVTQANELARSNDYEAAGKIVRALAESTPQGDARRQFERQAAELERVAAANRELEQYNEAVRQYNGGDRAAALLTLQHLIATSTDEEMVEDAKELKERLEK
jgi:hypothetical protein